MTAVIPPGPIDHMLDTVVSLERLKRRHARAFNTLTAREKEVLILVAEGLPNPGIASQLGLSRVTIQNHRANIRHKLDITSEADYVKVALAHELIKL